MGVTETLKMIVTADTAGAQAAFTKLGGEAEANLSKAEGGSGKLSGAMSALSANAVPIVAGIAAGLVKLGTSFADQAVAAGKFATQSGLSVEQASALRKVSEDLGVSTDALSVMMSKMLVNLGKSPKAFAALGVEIARTKNGTVDANGTFNNLIDHLKGINDPSQRAAEGMKLLGRNWKEIAPLIDQGSAALKGLEAAVPKGDIFHQADVDQAKAMKAAFHDLGDAAQSLGNQLGRTVVPSLAASAKGLTVLLEKLQPAFDKMNEGSAMTQTLIDNMSGAKDMGSKFAGSLTDVAGSAGVFTTSISKATDFLTSYAQTSGVTVAQAAAMKQADLDAKDATTSYADSVKNTDAAVKAFTDSQKAATTELANEATAARAAADDHYALTIATDKAKTAQADYNKAMKTAKGDTTKQAEAAQALKDTLVAQADATVKVYDETSKAGGKTLTASQNQDLWNNSMLQSSSKLSQLQKVDIANYIGAVNNIPADKLTEFKADVAAGNIDAAKALLDGVAHAREAAIMPTPDPQAMGRLDGAIEQQLNAYQYSVDVQGVVHVNSNGQASSGGGGKSVHALGTITSGPEDATIGEAGTEAVLPLTNPGRMASLVNDPRAKGPIMSALDLKGGGGMTNINVYGSNTSAADIARELAWGYKIGAFH